MNNGTIIIIMHDRGGNVSLDRHNLLKSNEDDWPMPWIDISNNI